MTDSALVLILDEPAFGRELHRVLTPSDAIQTPELLRGRNEQLDGIRRALYAPGRQIFIYGHRGVGKTSLAQTAAFLHQSSDRRPLIVACSPKSTCFDVVREIADEAFPVDPRLTKAISKRGGKAATHGFELSSEIATETGNFRTPTNINEAARLLDYVAQNYSKHTVVIIDEFDLITDKVEQNMFANLAKQIADKKISISLIVCGIGSSLDTLFDAHLSAHRYFHPVEVKRLPYEARFEIIDTAMKHLGISIDETSRWRIAMLSDGFPHYIHLVCEKLAWRVYYAANRGFVNGDLFEHALHDAAEELHPKIKVPYERAIKKYTKEREPILWACADGDEFDRPSRDIWQSFVRIRDDMGQPVDDEYKSKFHAHMNALKTTSQGAILKATRSGWYSYSEQIVRGYARLRAMQQGIQLEREHPLQRKRFNALRA